MTNDLQTITLIYESKVCSAHSIRQNVIRDVSLLIKESKDKQLYFYLENILTDEEIKILVNEGWGSKLATSLALIAGLVIGQIAPTSSTALTARNEIANFLNGGLSVEQSMQLINQSLSDKYAVTNLDWLKPYVKNLDSNNAAHQKLIKLIGNSLKQDPTIAKPVNTMSDQERSAAITNSSKLQQIVLNELGIKQDGNVIPLDELMNKLQQVKQGM